MQLLLRIVGTLFLALCLLWLLIGFGIIGSPQPIDDALDTPDGSGSLLATLIPAALLGCIGLWCWQPRKK